jgi:hypothetical protein
MQTVWNGFGLSTNAFVLPEVFVPQSCWVTLSDIPQVPMRVTLPSSTQGVALWTAEAQVWYAMNAAPGPIPSPVTGTLIDDDAFALGGVVMPNMWHAFAVTSDMGPQTLYLISQYPNITLLITAFTEGL